MLKKKIINKINDSIIKIKSNISSPPQGYKKIKYYTLKPQKSNIPSPPQGYKKPNKSSIKIRHIIILLFMLVLAILRFCVYLYPDKFVFQIIDLHMIWFFVFCLYYLSLLFIPLINFIFLFFHTLLLIFSNLLVYVLPFFYSN